MTVPSAHAQQQTHQLQSRQTPQDGQAPCAEDAATPRNQDNPGCLLLWLFFPSIGAGDPLARTWKQPEFPCNKAAVRKAQSN